MNVYEITIPKKRVAVLIGKKGKTKTKIQQSTSTKLEIDSKEGLVSIKGQDPIKTYQTRSIIEAIGRGFNPDTALSLLNEENYFEIIQIQDFTGKNKKKLLRLKSRIIGTKGKCRRIIEHLTDTKISIYGKTVSIIGNIENVAIAKQAIEDILAGAPHAPVYKILEQRMKQLK